MRAISLTLPSIPSFQNSCQETIQKAIRIDPAWAEKTLNYAKAEAKEMSNHFVIGTIFGKLHGAREPFSFGTVFSLSNLASKYIYPKFHRQFHCTPDTKARNVAVNLFASIATTVVANWAAYQIGCSVNADAIISMRAATVLIPTLMKAFDTPLKRMPEILPEAITGIALSILLGAAVHSVGYKIDPYTILQQQAAMVATSLHLRKIVQTGMYYSLKSIDPKDLESTPQPPPAVKEGEQPLPPPPPLPPKIKLTAEQRKLMETPESEILKSQAIATLANYAFFNLPGWIYWALSPTLDDNGQCPANRSVNPTCPISPLMI